MVTDEEIRFICSILGVDYYDVDEVGGYTCALLNGRSFMFSMEGDFLCGDLQAAFLRKPNSPSFRCSLSDPELADKLDVFTNSGPLDE